jgi:cell division septation protein DedD
MNLSHRKQSQFELFPGSAAQLPQASDSRYPFQGLTLSPENMIVAVIVLLMIFVLFFSLGVERGKRYSAVVAPQKIITGQNKTSDIMPPQLQTAQQTSVTPVKQAPVNVVPAGKQVLTPNVVPKPSDAPLVEPKSTEGSFTIQVASYKFEKRAQEEADLLKKLGHQATVMLKGSYYIVCVGSFEEKMLAQRFTSQLKGRYRDYLVRRL